MGLAFPLWLRRDRHPGLDQMFDEPACAELGVAASAASHATQHRVLEALRGGGVEVADPKTAFLDCVAEPARYRPILLNRDCRVALRRESFQKSLTMRPRPSRLISPFVARIPPIVICLSLRVGRKARPLVLGGWNLSE